MLTVKDLTKSYGSKVALNGISFTVGDGEIVGFLGPNGAGKSTTMNIITGCLSATSGSVKIDDYDILEDAFQAKKLLGYLPELPPLYQDMTVGEYLGFVYELKNCTFKRRQHLDEVMEVTKTGDVRGRVIGNLSKGYKQRVGIAQTLIGNPKVIVLDEPTVGLDPRQIIEIRNLVRTLGRDHTVVLSTHILSEVQAVCDRVIIINKGKLCADTRVDDLPRLAGGKRRESVKICGPQSAVLNALRTLSGVSYASPLAEHDLDSTTFVVESSDGLDVRKAIFNLCAQNGWAIIGLESLGVSMEDVFLSLLDRTDGAARGGKTRAAVKGGE